MVKNIIDYRKKYQGFFEIQPKVPVRDSYSLSLIYTPGVGRSCLEIKNNPAKSFELTNRANSIAVLTDCSTFPDFENINPLCAIPIVETKAIFYKEFAGIDAYPIVVNTHSVEEITQIIENLAPNFAGFDLDDFLPERTATIENFLKDNLKVPILYSYRKPNLFLTLERFNLIGKINPNIILPAIFRGAMDVHARMISDEIYGILDAALNDAVNCSSNNPDMRIAARIAYYVAKTAIDTGIAQVIIDPASVEEKYLDFLYEGSKSWFEKPLSGYFGSEHILEENSLELHQKNTWSN